jgi:hypothetical protein
MTALLDRWGIAYTCIKRKRESRFKWARGGAYRPASGVATRDVFDQNRHCTGAFSNGALAEPMGESATMQKKSGVIYATDIK